ncbi:hypothetical protein GCM10011512_10540 [Tersicoccus solisilvae]|uniref:AAA family ATPase n=1 Tax=Tersicoccus solisilvae TaxID=1882339 RepID=A0ABQ1NVP7_9MICC|nr:AAA family ATPase [Tersicoccus solisilvae]GGC85576.1 hypothetical protein GCM10011512_10540 [Tersicoccus solisilvae]
MSDSSSRRPVRAAATDVDATAADTGDVVPAPSSDGAAERDATGSTRIDPATVDAASGTASDDTAAPDDAPSGTASSGPADAPSSDAAPPEPPTEDQLQTWLEDLDGYSGVDTLLTLPSGPRALIDLTHAHPSGMAQLLSGRRTRLTTLLRDPDHSARAAAAARALRTRVQELAAEHGIDAAYLVFGTATFTSWGAGTRGRLHAPVLMARMELSLRPGSDDHEIQLTGQARVNPALLRHVRREYDVRIEEQELLAAATASGRFDPQPVLEQLRQVGAGIPDLTVEYRLLATTLADLSERLHGLDPRHPVIGALVTGRPVGGDTHAYPPLDERDPAQEFLVLDADSSQQEVLDLVRAGRSLTVTTPPGSGQTQTAVNAVATLAAQGKTVLVTAERRSSLRQFAARMDEINLGSTVLPLADAGESATLRSALVRAIVRNEKAVPPDVDRVHDTLRRHRDRLAEHVRSLHQVRDRWNCSPYQAMQALATLTATEPAPATQVRLKRSVLDAMLDRTELAERLRRAAELGSFSRAASVSPWFGARLMNRQQTADAHRLAQQAAEQLPPLRRRLDEVATASEISLGDSANAWGEQLRLLLAVRDTLDRFNPDIFDRPVKDLIAATASNAWRRERAIEMNSVQRSRLRRVAKEYIRPGVHIADLHTSLVAVEGQRRQWTAIARTQRHPRIPAGLAEIARQFDALAALLDQLDEVLPVTSETGLRTRGGEELQQVLDSLVADQETLATLPERTMLLESMREQGIDELLEDLARREVGPDAVAAELELTWWQSALEAMISGDDFLAMASGQTLRTIEAEYRLADEAHIAAGPARLQTILAQAWRRGLQAAPGQAQALKEALTSGSITAAGYFLRTPDLVLPLTPVVTASPFDLPAGVPVGTRFDAVVILDAESTSLPAALPAIARSRQVIALGDRHLDAVAAFSVDAGVAASDADPHIPSALAALAGVLPERTLTMVYRQVDDGLTAQLNDQFYDGRLEWLSPPPGRAGGLVVEYLPDGTGLPTSDGDVESTDAEVRRVVELVLRHAATRPAQSLAVIAGNRRHAGRVADAIRDAVAEHPAHAEFFASGPDAFRVVDLDRAAGVVRDRIILSLGYGRTPHGRVLHTLGDLSGENGRRLFAVATTRARHHLHVLTCFHPDDLDKMKLREGALDYHQLLERGLQPLEQAGTSILAGTVADGGRITALATGHVPEQSDTAPSPLVTDLAHRISARGLEVHAHTGGLDLSAVPAARGVAPTAMITDGSERYGAYTVRERSRLRPALLERSGWTYLTLWTIEVFSDPEGLADRVAGFLSAEAPAFLTGAPAATAGPDGRTDADPSPGADVDRRSDRADGAGSADGGAGDDRGDGDASPADDRRGLAPGERRDDGAPEG